MFVHKMQWLVTGNDDNVSLCLDKPKRRNEMGAIIYFNCIPHLCYHCGANVDTLGTHGLSCRFSGGRHFRHAMLNDILHRALSSANVPSRLEPTEQMVSVLMESQWFLGQMALLVSDATCVDTFAPSHLFMTASEVCAAANQAEQTKIKKYSYITSHAYHSFTPVAFETTGVCGLRSMSFLTDLGRRIVNTTGDKSSLACLLQKSSVAIQRGNAHLFGELCLQPSPPPLNDVKNSNCNAWLIPKQSFIIREKKKTKKNCFILTD